VIEVKFEKLDLEPDMYCRYDYVAFFNGGESDDSRRIGKFCGDSSPGNIVTNGNELLVQFVSDLSVTSDGFMAHYSSVTRESRTPTAGGDFIHRPQPTSRPQKPTKPRKPIKPTPKPTTKPALRPTPKPSLKPKLKPAKKPSLKPIKPTFKPLLKPTPKPTTKPSKPNIELISKPTPQPPLKLRPGIRSKSTTKPLLVKKPPLRRPTPKPPVKPTSKPKPAKPTPKLPVRKPTAKPGAKPRLKVIKPTLKPRILVKPSRKPWVKPKPTMKPRVKTVKPTPKSGFKPTMIPKIKPKPTPKPGLSRTVTKKPVVNQISALPVNPLCTQPCARTGTLQSNFCPHDFVITGKVTSVNPGPNSSATLEVSVIKVYKMGRLKINRSGPIKSVTLTSACKKCPGIIKGRNYVLMGKVDALGNGELSPSTFALIYQPAHAKTLESLSRKPC
ncbi:hypothetical protein XENOCAPTIV_010268, partial [Xenoophorus captivus]